MNVVKGLIINDLHFGIKDSKRMYDELVQFKNKVEEVKPEIIIIDGDYFDHKLTIGDPATLYAVSFFKELMDLCIKYKITLKMVQGTRGHELNQLQLFKPYEEADNFDFEIIETVKKEDVRGLHILFIPEEYPENSDEYYKEFKNDKYNIICGHGTWDFVAVQAMIDVANKETHSAPVFMFEEWKDCIKDGFISFGHIHGRNVYGRKIFYSGSFTRWNYGERSDKGFTYFEYDLDSKKYVVQFVDNTMAPKYDVLTVQELNLNLEEANAELIRDEISKRLEENMNLKINLAGLSLDKIEVLRNFYKNDEHIKIEIKEEKKTLLENKEHKDFEKWHYITKRQLPLDKMIQKYLEEECNTKLDLDLIDQIIDEKVAEKK